jgi:DUF4097 and DUF4098 domain-containing protein YvlB
MKRRSRKLRSSRGEHMSEERNRILRMLEEGKITADQAARLIQALGGSGRSEEEEDVIRIGRHGSHRHFFGPVRPPRPPRVRVSMSELDRIPDIVAGAVSSAMRSGISDILKTDFPGKNNLFLKSVSGDVAVEGWDEDRLHVSASGGITRVREREDKVMIRSISGDCKVRAPRESRLELVSVSGDVSVSGVSGRFGLKGVSGDIELKDFDGEAVVAIVSGDIMLVRVSGKLAVESKSGDVTIEPSGVFEGSVSSKSGDIELSLGSSPDVVLDMECEVEGEIRLKTDIPHEVLEQGEQSLRVKFGEGSREMKIRTREADITVRTAKE